MRKIAICNLKGGVGKTNLSINVASILKALGKKVLLIDCDSQGSATFGTIGADEIKYSIADIMEHENLHINEGIIQTDNYDLIPSDLKLSIVETQLVSRFARESILKRKMEGLKDYDYVIMDCSPSLSLTTINAMCSCDDIIIPCECEFFATDSLNLMLSFISTLKNQLNPSLNILSIVATKLDMRRNMSRDVFNYLKSDFNVKNSIRIDSRLAETGLDRKNILSFKNSRGYDDYCQLVSDLFNIDINDLKNI